MTKPPVPYPLAAPIIGGVIVPKTAMITSPATRWQDDVKWTFYDDNGVGTWFQPTSCGPPSCVAWIDAFVFGSHTPVNQRMERIFTPADWPLLAPGKAVVVRGIMDWYRFAVAVSPNPTRIYVKANGNNSFTTIPGIFIGGGSGSGAFSFPTVADGSGNVTVAFGIYSDDGVGSLSLGAYLTELEIVEPSTEWDIIIDSAVLYHNSVTPISISRDGFRFDPRKVYENYDYPGKIAPTYGGDELVSEAPALIGKFMMVGERHLSIYDPGGTWASSAFNRTMTPAALRTVASAGFYLSDVRCIWRKLGGSFLQARFPKAWCISYEIGSSDRNEGEIPVVIEARHNFGVASPKTTPLYYLDLLPSTWVV